jgi:hypothetical protein
VDKALNDTDGKNATPQQLDSIRRRKCTHPYRPTRWALKHSHLWHKIDCSPKNPIVFCHGLLGFDSVTIGPAIAPLQLTHWRGIKEVLEANNVEVLITRVPATSSVCDRAMVLLEKIEQHYGGRSVHLIGHSMVTPPGEPFPRLNLSYLTGRVDSTVDT